MRIHKEIKINTEEMEKTIPNDNLVKRVRYWIEDYNKNKDTRIGFTYSCNDSKCESWGYVNEKCVKWLDAYFVGVLGMKEIEKESWDNKSCNKYYFYEE